MRLPILTAALMLLSILGQANAQQQSTNWQELALTAQQNATREQMVANGMLAAMQTEIAELKAQLAKSHSSPNPVTPEPAK